MMPSGPKYEVTLGNALDNQDKTMSLAEKYARHGLPRGIGSEAIREYMPQIGSPAARGIEAETQSLEAEPGVKRSQAAANVINTARGEQDLLLTPEMHAARIRQMAEDSALAKAKALGLSQQYWMQPEKFKAEMGKLRLEAAGQALENAQKEFEILNQSDVLASQQAKDRAAVALSEARRFYTELQAEYFPEITETNLAGERADTRGTNATTDLTHARTTATVQGTQQRAQSFPLEQDARRQGLDQGALNLSQADAKFVTETYGKVFDSYMDVRSKTLGTRGWIGQREVDSLTMEQLAPSEGFFWSRDSQGNIRDGSPIDIDNPDLDSFRRSAGKWAAMQPGIPELKEKDPGAAAAYVAQQIRRLADLWRGKRYTQPRLPPP